MKNKKYAISSGHEETTKATEEILKKGGNAYDAILGAVWASTVVEPSLSSLAGGGFCLTKPVGKKAELFDFFVQTPVNKKIAKKVDFYPVEVDFGGAVQEFHIGYGAVATPGTVAGIFAIHKKFGTLPMSEIVKPAVRLARDGFLVDGFPAFTFELLEPIFKATPESFKIYQSLKNNEKLIQSGEILKNPEVADTIEMLAEKGEQEFYEGEIAQKIVADMEEKGGYLTWEDLKNYQVKIRKPLEISYEKNKFITNPTPSAGGTLIAFALKLLEQIDLKNISYNSFEYIKLLQETMEQTQLARLEKLNDNLYQKNIMADFLGEEYLQKFQTAMQEKRNRWGSTTHMSVIDEEGNMASLTLSNGEGSGYIVPGTGIMMNNMLGEEDLNPQGFHQWTENQRLSSMMAPSVLENENHSLVLGSAGSNRIRSAILQTIIRFIDYQQNLEQAVNDTRVHFENEKLDIEPGIDKEVIEKIKKQVKNTNVWQEKSVFFGGANCVALNKKNGEFSGSGDKRRDGVAIIKN